MDVNYTIISDHVFGGGNVGAVRVNTDSSATFNYGLFANNVADTDGPDLISGLSTMDSEDSVDYISPGSPDYDYHIQAGSPAKDAALGSSMLVDFDGNGRDATPDHGADEYGIAILSDGFESGGFSAWSSATR
jgi:hypothetical protein